MRILTPPCLSCGTLHESPSNQDDRHLLLGWSVQLVLGGASRVRTYTISGPPGYSREPFLSGVYSKILNGYCQSLSSTVRFTPSYLLPPPIVTIWKLYVMIVGIEPTSSSHNESCFPILSYTASIISKWWVLPGSNWRHSACKADALPTELRTHVHAKFSISRAHSIR